MKFGARILTVIMVITMMFSFVACGNNGDNENNVANNGSENNKYDNVDTDNENVSNNNAKEEIQDIYYEPDLEGIIGIAVYPVENKDDYPYDHCEKVREFDDWKFLYFQETENGEKLGEAVFDDNIVEREISGTNDRIEIEGYYCSLDYVFWGYIYRDDVGIYVLATHDFEDRNSSKIVINSADTVYARLHFKTIDEVDIPTEYQFASADIYVENYTEVWKIISDEFYSEDQIPESFQLTMGGSYLGVRVKRNGINQQYDRLPYRTVEEHGGEYVWEFNGFKGNESYQYFITVISPKPIN